MTFPVVTECSKAPQPVDRDTFADEPRQRPSTVSKPAR